LRGASPAGKADLLRQIKNLQCRLRARQEELRCCRLGNQAPTPREVWASDLKIKLDWVTNTGDTGLQKIERVLRAFNNRLYDSTDGQWRVGRFFIHDAGNSLDAEGKGVGHFHATRVHDSPNHGHAEGRPDDPEHFHATMGALQNTNGSANRFAGTVLMEFLHSWTGLKDEYEVNAGGANTSCPLAPVAAFPDACVMDQTRDPGINELCRPQNHNCNTEQGNVRGMDCYYWLAKVMNESGHRGFIVPCSHIDGPANAPALRFVYVTINRVRQIDPPGGDASGDFYARVSFDKVRMSRSKFKANDTDVSPNWLFGFAYSSDQARSIPISIEIWDAVGGGSDQVCDASPRANKRELALTFNPVTGAISGDAEGSQNRVISMKGKGDANRVAIDFSITSR
jgi:hypothetical protein